MSLEKDITTIKNLVEAEEVFKAATPEQVANRPIDYAQAMKEIIDDLEFRIKWLVDDLDSNDVIKTPKQFAECASKMRLWFKSADRSLKGLGL